ncbi:MAG: hypothetical protein CL866_02065 [Cycloclasticus sp.]|nr:hypothetical protein [Cycloclasticus sp.]MBG95645.1 hypothetical protein [Cycloclasticus sp.]
MEELSKSSKIKSIISALVALAVLIPALLLNTYVTDLYVLPKSLPILSIVLFFLIIRFVYMLTKLTRHEKMTFILTILGLLSFIVGVLVDWKHIKWIDNAGLLIFLPFLPAVVYALWVTRKPPNENT